MLFYALVRHTCPISRWFHRAQLEQLLIRGSVERENRRVRWKQPRVIFLFKRRHKSTTVHHCLAAKVTDCDNWVWSRYLREGSGTTTSKFFSWKPHWPIWYDNGKFQEVTWTCFLPTWVHWAVGPPSIAPSVQYWLLSVVGTILNPMFILLHEIKYCALVGKCANQNWYGGKAWFFV